MHWKSKYYIRKTHWWLGLIIGIQFLAWTLGGLYFSWSDIDEVHGDYASGILRPPLNKKEAIAVAQNGYAGKAAILSTEYLTEVGSHHEYPEDPLPAVAVTSDDARHTTVYVSTEHGTVQKFRNRPWRQFDFLWMLHTMDYAGRDNITN